jgi:hypothetical protein
MSASVGKQIGKMLRDKNDINAALVCFLDLTSMSWHLSVVDFVAMVCVSFNGRKDKPSIFPAAHTSPIIYSKKDEMNA